MIVFHGEGQDADVWDVCDEDDHKDEIDDEDEDENEDEDEDEEE